MNNTEFSGVRMTPNFLCVMSLKKRTTPTKSKLQLSCLEGGTQGDVSWTVESPLRFRSLPASDVPLPHLLWLLCRAGHGRVQNPRSVSCVPGALPPCSTAGWASPWVISSDSGSTLVLCGAWTHWTLSFYVFFILMSGHDKKWFF